MKTTYKILIICVFGILMFGIGFFIANQMCPAPVFDEPVLQSIKTYRNDSFRVELLIFQQRIILEVLTNPEATQMDFLI